MFKWFMAKSLTVRIIIVISTVVIVGGVTAGAIIMPQQVEKHQEEERQEQIRLENEEDLANMSIVLSRDKIETPLNGVTQGITIERYLELEELLPKKLGDEIKKDELDKVLTNLFVESYTGGELTIDIDTNINTSTRGDYPVTFTITSEKGNTKSETATITVYNFFRPDVYVDKEQITITKGTEVDIMEGVTFDSNLPKEEQGHIETSGTVDVNKVGTYEITYNYIPKEGTGENPLVENVTRTYKVIDNLSIREKTEYSLKGGDGSIWFNGDNFICHVDDYNNVEYSCTGTYIQEGEKLSLNLDSLGSGGDLLEHYATWYGSVSNNGKDIAVTDGDGRKLSFSLK